MIVILAILFKRKKYEIIGLLLLGSILSFGVNVINPLINNNFNQTKLK